MGRKYPRFLYSEPTDSKSEGPFVVHTLPPRFVCKLEFDHRRYLTSVHYVGNWEDVDYSVRDEVFQELRKWYNFSGRKQSSHPKDKILVNLETLDFLKNSENFTVEQVAQVIKICFPSKATTINKGRDINRIRNLMVNFANRSKYCSEETARSAFELCGFSHQDEDLCRYINILEKEYKIFKELTM